MAESKFKVGTKIFRWTVLSDRYSIGTGLYVDCMCECGTTKPVNLTSLSGKNPRSKSCGCLSLELKIGVIRSRLEIGQRFGRLLVVGEGVVDNSVAFYPVVCDCGVEKRVKRESLLSGATQSCGCLSRELSTTRKANLSHGKSGTPIHNAWLSMRRRCYDTNNAGYENYGGRGIKLCDRWLESFDNFYADMGDIPFEGASIERKDVNGDYSPENCVWADKTTQCFNRRKFKGTSSKYIGVSFDRTKKNRPWRVSLRKGGEILFSGSFATEVEAAKAYDEACFKYYGVRKNFPDEKDNQ